MAVGDGSYVASEFGGVPPVRPMSRWRSVFFAPIGDGQRRRRGSDGAKLVLAAIALVCCVLAIGYSSHFDRVVGEALYPAPHSISWLITVVYDAGSFGIAGALILLALVTRRWVVARDLGLAAVTAVAVSLVLILILGDNGGRPAGSVIHGFYLRFPVIPLAVFMAVVTAALPHLARPGERAIEGCILLVGLATVVGGHGLPVNVLGSLVIGWGAAAIARLIFGSPLGLPSVADVGALLTGLRVDATDVQPLDNQAWGVATYSATETNAEGGVGLLRVAVYGRDAADAKLLAKAGRFLFYSDSGPTLTFTRLQQVEHEAYLTLLADRAGLLVPKVIAAGSAGSSHDVLLVSRMPQGTRLSGTDSADLTDPILDKLFGQLLILRSHRIAHGSVSGETILVDRTGQSVGLVDFRNASSNAADDRLSRD